MSSRCYAVPMTRSPGWQIRAAEMQRRIRTHAIALFRERGFDEVTIAEIARAAGVAERTVYRYVGSKEAIVFEHSPGTFEPFLDALRREPRDLPVTAAVSNCVRRFLSSEAELQTDRDRVSLLRETPSLYSAWLLALRDLEAGLAAWLAERTGAPADDVGIRAGAAAITAAHRIANESWDTGDMGSYLDGFERALRVLGARLDDLVGAPTADRSAPERDDAAPSRGAGA